MGDGMASCALCASPSGWLHSQGRLRVSLLLNSFGVHVAQLMFGGQKTACGSQFSSPPCESQRSEMNSGCQAWLQAH